jgi:DNA-binding CsgD family transcriptional regulator
LIDTGHGDYPGSSHELTVARMATLLGNHTEAEIWFARARAALEANGQRPLRAIVDFDEALALARLGRADPSRRERLLQSALSGFRSLGMVPWISRAEAALDQAVRFEQRRDATRPAGLTEREVEVVRLVARGHSDRQISDELFVSPRTVNAHIRNILAKTTCSNRTELSVWALENGLILDGPPTRPVGPPPARRPSLDLR